MEPLFKPEDLISSYSRAQAIEDGELIDVTEAAERQRFRHPMAFTRSVYARLVEQVAKETGSDAATALDNILGALYGAVRRTCGQQPRLAVDIPIAEKKHETVFMHLGPGDTAEPVITVMYPEEA